MKGERSTMAESFIPPSSLTELLSMTGNTDPRLQMLAEFIQKRKNIAEEEEEARKKEAARKRVEETRQLRKEYAILVNRNNLLASAVGACRYCWGTDTSCECNGHGVPGSRYPDKAAFDELVLPVLNQLGIVVTSERGEELLLSKHHNELNVNGKKESDEVV
jgi:hypothetical protein